MPFESPRFAGDAVLEEILHDPDTGDKKLQKGSPEECVRAVQQALADLWWPIRCDPPIDNVTFADGDYGGLTERTVLRYKRQYGLHYPPTALTGDYDGYAGPRTLAMLDRHCVLLDELDAAIQAEASALGALVGHLPTYPYLGTMGASRGVQQGEFSIYARRGLGAWAVRDALEREWLQQYNGPRGPLGFPVGNEIDEGNGVRRHDFEFGSLRRSPPTYVVELVGPAPPPQVRF